MPTLVPSSEDTRIYETCILYPHPLTQKEEASLIKEIEAAFKEAKAKEISRDAWGRRGLAYTIGGFDQGNFLIMYHEMEPRELLELERNLQLIPNVLRFITVKPPKGYEVVDFSKEFEDWKKDQVVAEEAKKKEKEDKLKKRMLRKQKTSPKDKKSSDDAPKNVDKEKISADIDSLLDSNDITL